MVTGAPWDILKKLAIRNEEFPTPLSLVVSARSPHLTAPHISLRSSGGPTNEAPQSVLSSQELWSTCWGGGEESERGGGGKDSQHPLGHLPTFLQQWGVWTSPLDGQFSTRASQGHEGPRAQQLAMTGNYERTGHWTSNFTKKS